MNQDPALAKHKVRRRKTPECVDHHINVCKSLPLCEEMSSLAFYVLPLNLANYLVLSSPNFTLSRFYSLST